jgi:YHS domain-containing protein
MAVFIERLIQILILISAIRFVIRFLQGIGGGSSAQAPRGSQASGAQAASQAASQATMLQQDPVCGTYVAIDASLKKVVNGKVLHFCSDACRDKYRG